ncbi:MAG: flagellar hook-associated protein FlgK [Lachnospiraceae bacterium]|nr:flagellar hook-associated protein FlgK [Lachnospiraceae bacterium]
MPSTFFGLTIGYSGLTAAQVAQNTTANNIANTDTEGYTRQKLRAEAAEALRTYTRYGMAGSGVSAKSIDQLRDSYVDLKYWANQSLLGEYNKKQTYCLEIENYFNDTDTVPGFNTIYTENFFNALLDLEDEPGSVTTRTAFLGRAQSLVEYFNRMSVTMEKIQTNLNEEVKDAVDKVNSIAAQIASLNEQINVIEIRGVVANELRDQRAVLVDELSNYVTIETKETDIYNYADPDTPTGAKRYEIMISNGCSLVDGYDYYELECRAREKPVNQSDVDGLYDIYWKHTGAKFAPLAEVETGEIKGLLELRDGNNKEFFDGKSKETVTVLTNDSIRVGYSNKEDGGVDINKLTLGDSGMITIGGTPYTYSGWSYDHTTKMFTFNNLKYQDANGEWVSGFLNPVKEGDTVRVGQSINYQGIPYYQQQMNEWVRGFTRTFNSIMELGYDLNGNSMRGISFFEARDVEGDLYYLEAAEDFGSGSSTKGGLYYSSLTAKNFRLNENIMEDPSTFATTYNTESATNIDSNDLVKDLSSIKTDKVKMTFRGGSSSEFLQSLLSDVALNTQSAKTFAANYTNISGSLTNQRLSVSGVDADEEALDLVKFQHAYELNSKVIQTMAEMYDRLITQTGV